MAKPDFHSQPQQQAPVTADDQINNLAGNLGITGFFAGNHETAVATMKTTLKGVKPEDLKKVNDYMKEIQAGLFNGVSNADALVGAVNNTNIAPESRQKILEAVAAASKDPSLTKDRAVRAELAEIGQKAGNTPVVAAPGQTSAVAHDQGSPQKPAASETAKHQGPQQAAPAKAAAKVDYSLTSADNFGTQNPEMVTQLETALSNAKNLEGKPYATYNDVVAEKDASKRTVKMLQHYMQDHGSPELKADGLMGPDTRTATREFLKANTANYTGAIDGKPLGMDERAATYAAVNSVRFSDVSPTAPASASRGNLAGIKNSQAVPTWAPDYSTNAILHARFLPNPEPSANPHVTLNSLKSQQAVPTEQKPAEPPAADKANVQIAKQQRSSLPRSFADPFAGH